MRGYLNEQTKEVRPINQIEAEKLGLQDYEVEQAWDAKLYLLGYAPEKPAYIAAKEEIAELKAKLSATDYAVIKIAEGAATPEEYSAIIEQREAWRARINELEEIN